METLKPQQITLEQVEVSQELLAKIMKPYRPDTTYLKKAIILTKEDGTKIGYGEFSIQESCYIDDTGHFNAVEFNICYNQLAYTYLGDQIAQGNIPELAGFANDVFFEKQLSHFLIASITSSYKRPMNAKHFYGEFEIESIIKKSKCTFIKTLCKYYDDANGQSSGEITLAVIHP